MPTTAEKIRALTEDPGCVELARLFDMLLARLDACCPPSSIAAPAGRAPTATAPQSARAPAAIAPQPDVSSSELKDPAGA